MWTMLSDPVYGWTAATYLSTFIAFLVVSLPELVAWVLYLLGESFWFAWWANNIGFWFSVVGMGLPVIASMLQLGLPYTQGGLDGNTTVEFGANIMFLMSFGIPMWFQSAAMHLIYATRLKCFSEANPSKRSETDVLAECDLNRDDFELDS